ncbi:hypothetical protein BDV95DRAFT_610209 [Massariosphaeria phaeospora]|uniref:BTB domain-containing protein n=1 Tax=Massariosphaeria phaeospora TaxID=100035 RepID=A0A7C8I3C5_9PLEO|nr:hypothetical protein BDV95DRAFT_610209 [Massariosphaeria phaeospora]
MGASQSSPSPRRASEPPAGGAGDPTATCIRPYRALATNSRHIAPSSSYCNLYDGIVSLVQDNKYSDLIVICGDDRYPVHRAIVCPRSRYFEECCAPRDGEIDMASPGKPTKIWIDPSKCESHIVAAVLTFLYTLDYTAGGLQTLSFGLPAAEYDAYEDADSAIDDFGDLKIENEPSLMSDDSAESVATASLDTPDRSFSASSTLTFRPDPATMPNELVFHVQTYVAAQCFGITSLQDVARDKFEKRLRCGPWSLEMISCIREVYRQGSTCMLVCLKEDILKVAKARFRVLKNCEGWNDLVFDFPEFAADILRRM